MRTLFIGTKQHLVTRVVEVDIPRRALFIEELGDGTLRITYSKSLVPDAGLLEQLAIGPKDGSAVANVRAAVVERLEALPSHEVIGVQVILAADVDSVIEELERGQ